MPKVISERQRREKALDVAIAKAKVMLGLPHDIDVADALGMDKGAYSARKARGLYRGFGFDKAAELAQRLHFTGREVCEIMGVPYADPDP